MGMVPQGSPPSLALTDELHRPGKISSPRDFWFKFADGLGPSLEYLIHTSGRFWSWQLQLVGSLLDALTPAIISVHIPATVRAQHFGSQL